MHKSKKKSSKMVKIPKPIKIKKEKTEEDRTPQPMSHYVGDRLELIKQIFGSLKPKTITNLAPDFLKKKDLEEIQEKCLNELLGISKKRLLSIIDATKCPTDTESSSDSDVNNIEEHVSLEEISSDSEIEEGGARKSKKKLSGSGGKGGTKKNGVRNGAEKDEKSGQISVLELLELQARARAIRSQLALEPVTKIEVDSDDDTDDESSTKSKDSQSNSQKQRKRKSDEHAKTLKKTKTNGVSTTTAVPDKTLKVIRPNVEPPKKIKLKRNFRTNKPDSPPTTDNEKKPRDEHKTTATLTSNTIKEEKTSRSASPDVIPIVAEPVTLMISDSSDEEVVPKANTTSAQQNLKATTEAVVEVKSSKTAPIIELLSQNKQEQEDGEIVDENNEQKISQNNEQNEELHNIAEDDSNRESNEKTANDCNNDKYVSNDDSEPIEIASPAVNPLDSRLATETSKEVIKIVAETDVKEPLPTTVTTSVIVAGTNKTLEDEYDDDQNDDVISIEGGDLENEMTEHLKKDNSNAESSQSSSTADNKKTEEAATEETSAQVVEDDIISLNSSEDELTKKTSESWNTRWLKSSKISKVLATSRLGKRVRDKIKKTKRTKKDITREAAEAAANAEANKNNSAYTSKHEDGSIEQYKELLEMRQQRKN